MSNMEKTFKNVFVLTIGILIGVVISSPNKIKVGKQKLKEFFNIDPFDEDEFDGMFEE